MDAPIVWVAGTGPTGPALACGLRASGVAVRVVDKAPGPAVTSRALGLQPRGSEVLDRLGVLGDLPQRALPIRQVITHVDGEPVARLQAGGRTKLVTRPGLLMSQAEVEARLRHRLAGLGVEVEWGRELLGADQDGDGVTVRLVDGRVRADWLVGCDGSHSRVRKAAGVDFPGASVIERFLLADVRAELPLPRDAVSVWLDAEQMVGVFPLPGTDVWRITGPVPVGVGEDAGEKSSQLKVGYRNGPLGGRSIAVGPSARASVTGSPMRRASGRAATGPACTRSSGPIGQSSCPAGKRAAWSARRPSGLARLLPGRPGPVADPIAEELKADEPQSRREVP